MCLESFARELCIWASLRHKNILALIGVAVIDGMPVLASEWMENGNVIEFLTKNDNVDRLKMACIFVLFVMKAVLIS